MGSEMCIRDRNKLEKLWPAPIYYITCKMQHSRLCALRSILPLYSASTVILGAAARAELLLRGLWGWARTWPPAPPTTSPRNYSRINGVFITY